MLINGDNKIPPELQSLLDANRLLIISVSNATRQSKTTAHVRNKYICEIADQIVFVGVNETSSLYNLREEYQVKAIETLRKEEGSTEDLVE